MKKLICVLLTLTLLLGLTACGDSAKNTSMVAMEEAAEAPMAMAAGADMALKTNSTGSTASVPQGRKWIITVDMHVETDDLEVLQEALSGKIEGMEGYIEDQSVYNGSNYASHRYRNANLTVRIPADRIDSFTEEVSGISNVVSNNLRREDVTLNYVATESKVTALKTEETRLLELLAKAETMADLLEVEARLSDVRYELESYTTQLRTLDNQIDYATIYLYIEEVQEYTPVEDPTLWERITEGFADSLEGVGESLQDLLVFVIAAFPFLVVYGGAGVVIFLLVRKVSRMKKKKKNPEQKQRKTPPGHPGGVLYFGIH